MRIKAGIAATVQGPGYPRRWFFGRALAVAALGPLLCVSLATADDVPATKAILLIGAASVDITPAGPVALSGQFHLRINRTVETPLTANVVALESREGEKSLDV